MRTVFFHFGRDGQQEWQGVSMHICSVLDANCLPSPGLHQRPEPLHGKCQALDLGIKLVHLFVSFHPTV